MNMFSNIKGDFYGGITAAVVALPLALAFGVASGAGPLAGLWGAILVGFFASAFGGTPSQVSGPTGPMTVVMAAVIMQYANDPVMAFSVVIMGGVLQILFGIFRLGSLISLVPYTVISGFMSGIGCIIIILQSAPLFGHDIPKGGTVGALNALPDMILHMNKDALIVGLLSLILMVVWPKRLSHFLPAPLLSLIIGTLCVLTFLPNAPVIGDIPTGFPEIHIPTITYNDLSDMLGSALILALLGSIDSLLTSLIADSLTKKPHNSNRELIGQGIGNAIAGLFGAIPGAGATMRTVINIRAGGMTPLSGIIHALILFAIVMGLGPLAEKIPHAVLAGILIKVGWDIIDWNYLQLIKTAPRKGVVHMLLVLFLTVFVDLIVAVGAGLVLASLTFVRHMADLQAKSVQRFQGNTDEDQSMIRLSTEEKTALQNLSHFLVVYHFDGPLSFAAAKNAFAKLNGEHTSKIILFDFSSTTYIDTTAALTLKEAVQTLVQNGSEVAICGLLPEIAISLNGLNALKSFNSQNIFQDRKTALLELSNRDLKTVSKSNQ